MKIFIVLQTGKDITLHVELTDTLAEFLQKLDKEYQHTYPSSNSIIYQRGGNKGSLAKNWTIDKAGEKINEFDSAKTLNELNICEGFTLRILPRYIDGDCVKLSIQDMVELTPEPIYEKHKAQLERLMYAHKRVIGFLMFGEEYSTRKNNINELMPKIINLLNAANLNKNDDITETEIGSSQNLKKIVQHENKTKAFIFTAVILKEYHHNKKGIFSFLPLELLFKICRNVAKISYEPYQSRSFDKFLKSTYEKKSQEVDDNVTLVKADVCENNTKRCLTM